ncbi:MAG: cadmium-translocating P-type ATPase [Phycisphaerae bacterium]|nr:cadmium-translocating P-type ATPase [Phycisphaerae bacterium]
MTMPEPNHARITLDIRGMHCAGCVGSVERALSRVPGVVSSSVNLTTEQATVISESDDPSMTNRLLEAVRHAGYEARLDDAWARSLGTRRLERKRQRRRQRRGIIIAAILGLPVIFSHLLVHGEQAFLGLPPWLFATFQGLLTLGVFAAAALPIFAGAARALLRLHANMDLLVTLGALTAFGTGVGAIIADLVGPDELIAGAPSMLIFETAVMIVLFVSIGKYLESRARGHASAALEALHSRIPREALRVVEGKTQTVSIDDVRIDDVLRVAPHGAVPVDGVLVAGHVSLDESMLTGESLPVERDAGDAVFGGTRVTDGMADLRATATGQTSAAARIAQLVDEAQASKPPWQRLADRFASVFVPIVLLLAAGTFLGWLVLGDSTVPAALMRTIAVLVVACPCAMGLAIPTAVAVGTALAAERGILVRDPGALEAAGSVIEVVVDKTGTLTRGQPGLRSIEVMDGHSEQEVLRWAAALAQHSDHPLAAAVTQVARDQHIELPEPQGFRSVPGGGVLARIDDHDIAIGSETWLGEQGIRVQISPEQQETHRLAAVSVAWLAVDRQVAAMFSFADELHPESEQAVAELRRLGVIIRILSGDRRLVVSQIAKQLKIKAYEAELTPAQKLDRIRDMATHGCPVAMVGDGVNDAPALAAASVGIAIGTGADVAREAAGICLVGHSPLLIASAIRLSRQSRRIMRQNLFWAFAYNVVMLPVAILTPLPPTWATAAMMCSSLTVVLNSLRLRRIV